MHAKVAISREVTYAQMAQRSQMRWQAKEKSVANAFRDYATSNAYISVNFIVLCRISRAQPGLGQKKGPCKHGPSSQGGTFRASLCAGSWYVDWLLHPTLGANCGETVALSQACGECPKVWQIVHAFPTGAPPSNRLPPL